MTNNNLKMFCLTLEPSHQSIIKEMGYEPVGLGEKIFPEDCFSDKQGNNISKKNPPWPDSADPRVFRDLPLR